MENKGIVILLILILGCLGYMTYAQQTAPAATQQVTYLSTGTTQQAALPSASTIPQETTSSAVVTEQYVTTDANAAVSANTWVENADWDSTDGKNGLLIHFIFTDASGNTVLFSNQNVVATVKIFTPLINAYNAPITSTRILYQGTATITSAKEGLNYPLRGIRVAWSDIDIKSSDKGIGSIYVKFQLPAGKILESTEKFPYPK